MAALSHGCKQEGGIKGGAVVRAGIDAICGLSLLLVLSFAPVSPSPQKPTFPNSNLTRNQEDIVPLCGCPTSKLLFNGKFAGWVLGLIFAGYVPLSSQSPNPIIVYSVANYRPHLSHFWANM